MSTETKRYKVENLYEGQEVAIANYCDTARVAERLGKNQYRVRLADGRIIQTHRVQLAVNVHGSWMHGPYNETPPKEAK